MGARRMPCPHDECSCCRAWRAVELPSAIEDGIRRQLVEDGVVEAVTHYLPPRTPIQPIELRLRRD